MVVGATSGVGKSTLVSALCRAFARRGLDVAPFKAQNMSNHSAVTPDGGEIGRAQAMQALAARVETDRRMGPVLLKPSGVRSSHVVVTGEEVAVDDAVGYGARARALRPVVLDALGGLRREHELVVLEGAGGAAETNLFDRDVVNLPLAAAAGIPAVLVVDIDRGGAFASAYGSWALLPERLRSCLQGFVINGMRGEVSLLDPAIEDLQTRTGLPVLGVLPHLGDHLMLGVEDSLDLTSPSRPTRPDAPPARPDARSARPDARSARPDARPAGQDARSVTESDDPVRIAVVGLPRLANPSDLDPLVLEPAVELRWATRPGDLTDADLVVVPGSRATVADLAWLRERGLDQALRRIAADPDGAWVLGLCAGYQILGDQISDPEGTEAEAGTIVDGLGLLPVRTTFTPPKTVRRSNGRTIEGDLAHGYEIRWGSSEVTASTHPGFLAWIVLTDTGPEGCARADGRVRGTSLHGVLDSDTVRHRLLSDVAAARGRTFAPSQLPYAAALDQHLDHLGRWVEEHLDLDQLLVLASRALPPGAEPGW